MNEEPSVTEAELACVAELDAYREDASNPFAKRIVAIDELAQICPRIARELAAARAAIKVAREPWEKLKTLYPNSPHIIHIADAALAQLNTHAHE